MPDTESKPGAGLQTDMGAESGATAGRAGSIGRALGLGLITGAADDDPSAIGTYASAGAKLGAGFLWTAPVTLPMMFAVVYLSAKLGQVSGRGLFHVIRDYYPRWVLLPVLAAVLFGNTVEAGADLGGMAAAMADYVHVPQMLLVAGTAGVILALQLFGSYTLIRNVFRWLALLLLAYVGAALLGRPDWGEVLRGTLIPHVRFDRDFLTMTVAVIGTTLSAYIYSWQSNQEVEEKIAAGKTTVASRRGSNEATLAHTRRDVWIGMIFSNLVMYFIILSTASTLHKAGHTDISSAKQAAEALRPLAGNAAGLLFLAGMIGVGFLAVPVMTTGAAYDLAQTFGWRHSLHARPREAVKFYAATVGLTVLAVAMNFVGINPLRALVWAGIVQGFSTPPLLLLIMLMTNDRRIMGARVNGAAMNVLGWATVVVIFAASAGLVVSWSL